MDRLNGIPAVAAAFPGLALAVLSALWLVMAGANAGHPFWRSVPVNVAEAAALRDAAEVARLVEAGADPNRTYSVRPGLVEGCEGQLTPVQAARLADRSEIVDLLMTLGAHP
jgi:hypothetical protein